MDASDSSSFNCGAVLLIALALALMPASLTYAASAGTWSPTGSMTYARVGHTATRLRNGKVLIVGGGDTAAQQTAELYDPSTGQFSLTGSPIYPRTGHTATLMRDGRVLIDGGTATSNPSEIYNPATGEFTATGHPLESEGSIPGNRRGGNAALLPDGRVVVAFGIDSVVDERIDDVETYDPATGSYTEATVNITCQTKGSGYTGRDGVASATLNNGEVLFTGGNNWSDGSGASANCAELFDPSTNVLANANPMTTDRDLHTATVLSDGRVLVAGGLTFCSPDCAPTDYHGSAELYDPSTGVFTATGAMTDSRYDHTGTLLPDGEILVAGGGNSNPNGNPFSLPGAALPWVDLYDAATAAFTRTGSLHSGRYSHTATFLPNGLTLVTGGNDSSGNAYATAELYTPSNPINLGVPQSGDIVFGNVFIEVELTDQLDTAKIYIDGKLLVALSGSESPRVYNWVTTSAVSNGLHVIRADAVNTHQQVVGSSSVTVNLANGPVALFWPKENATVSHLVAVAATLQTGVQWADFYVDGKFLKPTPPRTIYWDSTTVANGSHTLSVKGFNSSDQLVGTDSAVVNVSN